MHNVVLDEKYLWTLLGLSLPGFCITGLAVVIGSLYFFFRWCECEHCPDSCIDGAQSCCGGNPPEDGYSKGTVRCSIATLFFFYLLVGGASVIGAVGTFKVYTAVDDFAATVVTSLRTAQQQVNSTSDLMLALDGELSSAVYTITAYKSNASIVLTEAQELNSEMVTFSIAWALGQGFIHLLGVAGLVVAVLGCCMRSKCWSRFIVALTFILLAFSGLLFSLLLPSSVKVSKDICDFSQYYGSNTPPDPNFATGSRLHSLICPDPSVYSSLWVNVHTSVYQSLLIAQKQSVELEFTLDDPNKLPNNNISDVAAMAMYASFVRQQVSTMIKARQSNLALQTQVKKTFF